MFLRRSPDGKELPDFVVLMLMMRRRKGISPIGFIFTEKNPFGFSKINEAVSFWVEVEKLAMNSFGAFMPVASVPE